MYTAKKKYPDKASDQEFIARCVDALLEKTEKTFLYACPAPWRKEANSPKTLQGALQHPALKGRVKTFISKVKV